MIDGAPSIRVARVVHPPAQVLDILPGSQARPVRTVEVGREPFACFEIHIGHHKVQLGAIVVPVLYPDHGQPVRLHARRQKFLLETVDQLEACLRRVFEQQRFFLGETEHARRVPLGERERVDQHGRHLRIAAQ
jgi:hypothetical protein